MRASLEVQDSGFKVSMPEKLPAHPSCRRAKDRLRKAPMNQSGFFTRMFFWLSGASTENLDDCPSWERRKYVAFGATVLVPCVFAMIAAAYAVSTLTDNLWTIVSVALAWAFIILTVDRALLATYRAYQSFFRKISQLGL